MKKKSIAKKTRNAYAVNAKKRKAGKIKNKKDKRKNGKNIQKELLKDCE